MRVLCVASEVFPLVKTGGLADVTGALPAALAAEGIEVVTLMPGYPAVMAALDRARTVVTFDTLMGGTARLLGGRAAGLDLLVLDAPHLYDRPGNPYSGADGRDWPDNGERFAALAFVAAEIGRGLVPRYRPMLIHAHDWQAALVPPYLHYGGKAGPPTILTIHNLAFQGRFSPRLLQTIGLPETSMMVDGVEYYGDIGFLKAGILFADRISTVSPSYAAEIATDAGGMGLGGLIAGRSNDLAGILNGIDTSIWNPRTDKLIAARFDADHLEHRRRNKTALQQLFNLDPDPDAPLFGVISRLTGQKGLDVLVDALPELLAGGGQLVLLGTGDPTIEAGFRSAAARNMDRVGCLFSYDEPTAHLIQAGSDALIVPSRFEPCGLTQLCALRYGSVPVVGRTGGLADTIIDANEAALQAGSATGFSFWPVDLPLLVGAIRRAIATYRDREAWKTIQRNGMRSDFSWRIPAGKYAALYRDAIGANAKVARTAG